MIMRRAVRGVTMLAVVCAAYPVAAAVDGAQVYRTHCAVCHDSGTARTPSFETLSALEPDRIVRALETGVMRMIGNFNLTGPERVAVAEYITGRTYDPSWRSTATNACAPGPWPPADPFRAPHWNGWGADQANTRFQPAEMAKLAPAAVPALELRWAFAFPGETFTESQPAVVGGRLFVGSPSGAVYALDATTGCLHWSYQAEGPVKAPVLVGPFGPGARLAVFFGDQRARVYALDAKTGELLWQAVADEHQSARVTGGVQLFEGRLYVPVSSLEEGLAADPKYRCCTFRGSLVAYDAATGKPLWKRHTIEERPQAIADPPAGRPEIGPSGASVWSAATIDAELRRIYLGTGDNYSHPATGTSDAILALALDTGEPVWVYQGLAGDAWNIGCMTDPQHNCPEAAGPDQDMGASPILTRLPSGQRILLGAQKSGVVHVLDPDRNGRLLWQKRLARGGVQGGLQWGQATDGRILYAAISDLGWLDSPISGSAALDPARGGGLIALDLATGEALWQAPPVSCAGRKKCSPAQTAAVTLIPGIVFSGSQSGVMRAFAADSGSVVWQYDSARDYQTVNGARGFGGSIDQAGPVVVDGMVYFNSGYSKWGALPGNVVLAFARKD